MEDCKRMTVHAIAIDGDGTIVHAQNYNETECTGEVGKCGCVHAEMAILRKMPHPQVMVVSHAPCLKCAEALVQAGVKAVDFLKLYRLTEGVLYLVTHGVHVQYLVEQGGITYEIDYIGDKQLSLSHALCDIPQR